MQAQHTIMKVGGGEVGLTQEAPCDFHLHIHQQVVDVKTQAMKL